MSLMQRGEPHTSGLAETESEGDMSQQSITIICAIAVLIAVVISFVRAKRHAGANKASEQETPSIKQTIDEAASYFGIESSRGQNMTEAFDLAPVSMLHAMVAKDTRKQSGQKRRSSKTRR